ncbi:hypothetical protein [Pseudomonas putida]|uniref:hypothetical protein n=1 Tax=Pseudomonas TaxID=286 RepID=UPI001F2D1482|nr:hypothetical protein [Pseudomonas putida]
MRKVSFEAPPRQGLEQGKARFWQAHRESGLSAEQTRVLNRLLAGLLDKGCLQRLPGGGRSTRYRIRHPDDGQT